MVIFFKGQNKSCYYLQFGFYIFFRIDISNSDDRDVFDFLELIEYLVELVIKQ